MRLRRDHADVWARINARINMKHAREDYYEHVIRPAFGEMKGRIMKILRDPVIRKRIISVSWITIGIVAFRHITDGEFRFTILLILLVAFGSLQGESE